jgi:hypothetical protein
MRRLKKIQPKLVPSEYKKLDRYYRNLPRLKKTGLRNIIVDILNPPHRRRGIMHALKTSSSVNGAWSKGHHQTISLQ